MRRRYRLYLADLPLSKLEYKIDHSQDYIDYLMYELARRGQVNPVLVTRDSDGRYIVHPGKGRCTAAERLGWEEINCIVYCPDGAMLPMLELSPEAAESLLSEDCYAEYGDRFFAVKKKAP